jgi:hypothetical protein
MEMRLKDKALDYYLSRIEPQRDMGLIPYVGAFWGFMDGVYDNPDRAINARYGYHNLRMKHLQDFNEFRAQFARLAYIADIPRNQSKLDIRNKLYDGLRLGMETKVSKERREAQQLARGLKQNTDKNRTREAQQGRGGGKVNIPVVALTQRETSDDILSKKDRIHTQILLKSGWLERGVLDDNKASTSRGPSISHCGSGSSS